MDRSAPQQDHSVGRFNYLHETTESSLYRNGQVLVHRDPDGGDSRARGIELSRIEKPVYDARSLPNDSRPSLASNGFELFDRPRGQASLDFLDLDRIVADYYPECARIIEAATGGRALAFDHNVRSLRAKESGKRIAGGQSVQEPIQIVHGDYTLSSGPQRLIDLSRPPTLNDTLRTVLAQGESLISSEQAERALGEGGRFAIINLWRNIAREPVASHPLALCDSQSVHPEDLVVFEIHYQDRIGENYFSKHADRHRWYYYPEMTGDEALLIKQWDSAGTLASSSGRLSDGSDHTTPSTFSYHSAFVDPKTPTNAPDRESIEVRCLVLFDD